MLKRSILSKMATLKQTAYIMAIVIALSALFVGVGYIGSQNVDAADASKFQHGRIIDNKVFTNAGSMSTSSIQNFLKNKNSACLKNYMTPKPLGDNKYGEDVKASRAIKIVSNMFKISPKTILVTLQKEQSLVTRSNCPDWRYDTAMGVGCPDNEPCKEEWLGFSRQIYQGARHFRGFFDLKDDWIIPHRPGDNNIKYHPDSGCGTKDVWIENRATAALYSYTPYTPNKAALKNLYSTGDSCSSYGNRNFWRNFTDWFGSPHSDLPPLATTAHPDGTMVKPAGDPTVSYNTKTQKSTVPFPKVLKSYGYEWSDVKDATKNDQALSNTEAVLGFDEGSLVKGAEDPIYIVRNSEGKYRKHPFSSWDVFTELGHELSDVYKVSDSNLPENTGSEITSSNAHTTGDLVKEEDDPTVYYIGVGWLRAFPNPGVLFSHGFTWSDIKTATEKDLEIPKGKPMYYREGTIIKGSDPAVYAVDYDSDTIKKRRFDNWTVFRALRYSKEDIYKVKDDDLPDADGPVISDE